MALFPGVTSVLRACEKISGSRFLLPEFDKNRPLHEGNDPHE
jgi:hypothetical protein